MSDHLKSKMQLSERFEQLAHLRYVALDLQ